MLESLFVLVKDGKDESTVVFLTIFLPDRYQ